MIARRVAGFVPAGAAVLVLAACAPSPEVATGEAGSEAPDRPVPCNAEDARSLIGSHVGAVTFTPGLEVRIACTTCPVTEDHRPDRLNVRFDEETGIIREVSCG